MKFAAIDTKLNLEVWTNLQNKLFPKYSVSRQSSLGSQVFCRKPQYLSDTKNATE
jgi:hypothetical protein